MAPAPVAAQSPEEPGDKSLVLFDGSRDPEARYLDAWYRDDEWAAAKRKRLERNVPDARWIQTGGCWDDVPLTWWEVLACYPDVTPELLEHGDAQPQVAAYILDKGAILDLVVRFGEARFDRNADRAGDLLDAIRAALTPIPAVELEPAWGSGPLVEHNPETPGAGSAEPKWDPSENCYCGGPEEIYPHRRGTGRACRRRP